jgi:hypothetical protein
VKLLRLIALVAALGLGALALVLLALEGSGWVTRRVQTELRAALGEDASIESARLDWFAPAVEIEGFELGDERGGVELGLLRAQVRVVGGRVELERLDLRGGELRLSDQLIERLERTLGAREPGAEARSISSGPSPTVVVDALGLVFLHPVHGALEIGRVDALSREDASGTLRIEGRVTPSFSAARGPRAPQIFLAGGRSADGVFEVVASCAGIPLDSSALPAAARGAQLESFQPRARLEFELSARFQLDANAPAEGALRARIDEGVLEPPGAPRAVTELHADVDARCQAKSVAGLLDPAAWRTTAHAKARWGAAELEAWALAGANAGEGLSARTWIHAPRLPLDEAFLRDIGLFELIERNWRPLSPRGHADVLVGARWRDTRSFADTEAASRPEIALDLRLDGETGVTYFGWPRSTDGQPEGFPAPVEQVVGRALAIHAPDADHAALLALLEVIGAHSGGARTEQPAFIEGLLRFERPPPPGAPRRYPAFDLEIGTHGFPVDARLRTALLSLLPEDMIWRQFGPNGGHLSAVVRLFRPPGAQIPAGSIQIDLFGVDAAFRPQAAPADGPPPPELAVRGVSGRVEILTDPRLAVGVRFDLKGSAAQRADVSVRGRVQDDAAKTVEREEWQARRVQELEVRAGPIGLGGADRRALSRVWPAITREIERREANGLAALEYRSATERTGGPLAWRVEVTPLAATLSPEEFRVDVRNVRGRVIVTGADPLGESASTERAAARVRLAPLLGDTLGSASVACNARIDAEGPSRIEVLAAGISPSNAGIVGAFKHAFEGTARGGQTGLSLSALAVDGRVDLSGTIVTSPLTPARPVTNFRVRLRENDVQTQLKSGRFELDRLTGVLESRGDELRGEKLNAELAGAPIELRNARFVERQGGAALESDFSASNFALDREHLSMFLEPRTVDVLLGERALQGAVDIRDARLKLESAADAAGAVEFSGTIVPRRLALDLGLPLAIDDALIEVSELRYDSEIVRARATLRQVNGRIADRRLSNALLELEYDDPTLTLRDVRGELESGLLSRLDPRGERPAFQIDLRAPFAFRLGLALERADVGRLLAGLFESEFATRGRVSMRLELDGDLDRMSAIRGQGRVDLRDSNLWSVPVVRGMVSQFGLDSRNALFDSIQSRFTIEGGVVRMSELDISSAYFGVSGEGTLDFDGSLHHDFEVRNSVVNLLGPFKSILYTIAVRGDMARPRVETYGVIGGLFGESKRRTRALPLPGLSPLPARF